MDKENLFQFKKDLKEKSLKQFSEEVREEAGEALSKGPYSVINDMTVCNLEKNSYQSFSPYYYKSKKGRGLHKVDGLVNRKVKEFEDKENFNRLMIDLKILSLAYFFYEDEIYALKAIDQLKCWFLDAESGMLPHLEYAQMKPGTCQGNPSGVIEFRKIAVLPDIIQLLKPSPNWNQKIEKDLKEWLSRYLIWLEQSDSGIKLMNSSNNLFNYYYLQRIALASYLDRPDSEITKILDAVQSKLVNSQLTESGKMPLEEKRGTPINYILFNLRVISNLSTLAVRYGKESWFNLNTPLGRRLYKTLERLPDLDGFQDTNTFNKNLVKFFKGKYSNNMGEMEINSINLYGNNPSFYFFQL
ncbi:alginate lyase family protein [Leeuwenhoekiella marinoflava]|nr:alginate lyase family protein [Leeuwenhoekiella marinoflava]